MDVPEEKSICETGIPTEKAVLHEPQTEQENMNREHINYEEDK